MNPRLSKLSTNFKTQFNRDSFMRHWNDDILQIIINPTDESQIYEAVSILLKILMNGDGRHDDLATFILSKVNHITVINLTIQNLIEVLIEKKHRPKNISYASLIQERIDIILKQQLEQKNLFRGRWFQSLLDKFKQLDIDHSQSVQTSSLPSQQMQSEENIHRRENTKVTPDATSTFQANVLGLEKQEYSNIFSPLLDIANAPPTNKRSLSLEDEARHTKQRLYIEKEWLPRFQKLLRSAIRKSSSDDEIIEFNVPNKLLRAIQEKNIQERKEMGIIEIYSHQEQFAGRFKTSSFLQVNVQIAIQWLSSFNISDQDVRDALETIQTCKKTDSDRPLSPQILLDDTQDFNNGLDGAPNSLGIFSTEFPDVFPSISSIYGPSNVESDLDFFNIYPSESQPSLPQTNSPNRPEENLSLLELPFDVLDEKFYGDIHHTLTNLDYTSDNSDYDETKNSSIVITGDHQTIESHSTPTLANHRASFFAVNPEGIDQTANPDPSTDLDTQSRNYP